ncbi:MAG: hypothetical protein HY982_01525 [Candidatus Magasanikbacteria bacterium]|nr:hypothetical protein [Candidatus Magasanikbacteria bacterium]
MIKSRLERLGLNYSPLLAEEVYASLLSKIKSDDQKIFPTIPGYRTNNREGSELVAQAVKKVVGVPAGTPRGFFLKLSKIESLLKAEPPPKIMKFLGYRDADSLLAREDILEVFSALRFLEGNDWLNGTFFNQYEKLRPSDFEEREVIVKTIDPKWVRAAGAFIQEKYHNVSHLKELGTIFIIPVSLGVPGELLRTMSLISHYFNEVGFYSDLFRRLSLNKEFFAQGLISLLRGDVLDERLPASVRSQWFVVQRYLAKKDENDWRLLEPHVNPEVLHWGRAESLLFKYGDSVFGSENPLRFWEGLSWVGDYFKTRTGIEVVVSFNLADTAMSLARERENIKYLYHQQECLWNRIFSEYFGEERMEESIKTNIWKGWFEI